MPGNIQVNSTCAAPFRAGRSAASDSSSLFLAAILPGMPFARGRLSSQRLIKGPRQIHQLFVRTQSFEHLFVHLEFLVRQGGRLDAQSDTTIHRINTDNPCFDLLPDRQYIGDILDALFADLPDVHQALDPLLDFDKSAEGG